MRKILLFLFITSLAFPQSKTSALEDKIYAAMDVFVAHPNEISLKKLEASEKTFHPKSKSELLAFAILQCNKAYYQNQFGQTQKAIKSYESAWQLFQKNKLSHYDIIESCLQPLGNLYTIIGDYDNAENVIKQYYFIASSEKKQHQKYAAVLNLSNVYQNTGRIQEAIDLLEKTIAHEKLTAVQKGILYTNLGNNYLLSIETLSVIGTNPFQNCENAYKKAIALLKPEKNQSETLAVAYQNLAKRYAVTQKFDWADAAMENAKTAFDLVPNPEPRKKAQLYFEMASLAFRQRKLAEASRTIAMVFKTLVPNYSASKGILPDKNMLYAETILLDALDLQAEIFLSQNHPEKALDSYNLSFHIEELFQSLLVYENSKIITQVRNRNRSEKCIDIYFSLYQKKKKTSYLESAFLLSERTKSAVLKQIVSNSKTATRSEKLLLEQLQNWNSVIVKEQQKLDLADIPKINKAIKKQNELMLMLKSERDKSGKKTSSSFRITDLYAKLEKDKAVLVEYFMGNYKMYVFTLADRKIKLDFFRIDHTQIPHILSFLEYFSNSEKITNDVSGYNHYGFLVCKMLKLPQKSSAENLIIVPDGILNFLPFEALVSQKSNTTNFAQMHYLLRDFKIGYNNSADFYLNALPLQHQKQTVLGVFPIFENTELELAFSKKELQNLQDNFEGKYLEKEQANFGNFKRNAANYPILHLSTHAASGDIYEPASIRFYNQETVYSEFYNLNAKPDLVVLSACETGIGKLYKAEGPMSIARGFQFAGAQNLLFSLWKVNDFTTSVLMEKFYRNVKNRQSYFEAGHQAKLDFLNDTTLPNAKKSPYYWASFVYYGTLEKQPETNYFLWIPLLGGLIALLLLWKFFRSKKRNLSSH